MDPSLLIQIRDNVAIIQFNKPAQRNTLSSFTLRELDETLDRLLPRNDIKGFIFTGTGETFASGADIKELAKLEPTSALQFSRYGQRIFGRIAEAKQLMIAAINGYCMGGALDLALACDVRVASKNAVFSHPGARRGIITGWGGTQRLPHIIGPSRALEMFVTASQIDSAKALSIGLVTAVEDPVLECALAVFHQSTTS